MSDYLEWIKIIGGGGAIITALVAIYRTSFRVGTRALELWAADRINRRELEEKEKERIEHAFKQRYDTMFEYTHKQMMFLAAQVAECEKKRKEEQHRHTSTA